MQWLDKANDLLPELTRLRRHIHQNPEVGFEEIDTANFIADYLTEHDIPFSRIGKTGIVGMLDTNRPGPVLVLRADIDALPVQEENECEYKSKRDGFMHACGHDVHASTLMVTAKFLKDNVDHLCGKVKFLFQPSEESPPGGALEMIKAGVLEDVDAIYGLHVNPEMPVGMIGIIDGPMMAASDKFIVKVIGRGGHGASPHETNDAVIMASQLVNNLQTIVSRNVNPMDSAVVTVGLIRGGTRFNIIAETCEMEGTVRTLRQEVREMVKSRIEDVIKGTISVHNADYKFEYEYGYPPLINSKASADVVRQVGRDILGPDGVQELPYPWMAGEDFAYYLQKVPGAFFRLGTSFSDRESFPLHNPRFDADENAMTHGVRLFAGLVNYHNKRS